MAQKPLSQEVAQRVIDAIHEALEDGFPMDGNKNGRGATAEAAFRLGIPSGTMFARVNAAKRLYSLEIDPERFRKKQNTAIFEMLELPDDGEPSAEEMIEILAKRQRVRLHHHEAAKLREVRMRIPGPVALVGFGDPHVDDPGCDWASLQADVNTCRDTLGMLAIGIGDNSNNWVGRLMKLYADQEVTARQSLKLIEWLMTSLPWLLQVKGNHDTWNTEKGDVADYIHRLSGSIGAMESSGARLRLDFNNGSFVNVHARHDFPGGSQFNPAHALVRQTLFDYRDHILMCGHRHTSGYIPIWHNDPKRLCHGMRLGAYKTMDHYADEKGFKESNWARAMVAVIDPDLADDPVRHIKVWFNVQEAAEYLTWRRKKWELGYSAAA